MHLSLFSGMLTERPEAIETYKKQTEAKIKVARAEYLAAHLECSEKDINVFAVIDDKTRELTGWVIMVGHTGGHEDNKDIQGEH